MKRAFKRMLALMLVICIAVACGAVAQARADEERLSVSESKLWVSTSATLTCTLDSRREGEELEISTSKKGIIKFSRGKWSGDSQKVIIKAQKAGELTLTIAYGGESCKVKLYVREKTPLTPEEIYAGYSDAMVEIKCYDSVNNLYIGSGFFVGNGKVLTNYHVIDSAVNMTIKDYSGKEYSVKRIYGYDETVDLALIGVSAKNKNSFIISEDEPETGDSIYTIGSPLGYTGTFSDGIVSYKNRTLDDIDYIQITAATSTGSGGGPLINSCGEVIGINTLTVGSAQNINFALPVKYYLQLDTSDPVAIREFYAMNRGKIKTQTVNYADVTMLPSDGSGNKAGNGMTELSPEEIYSRCREAMVEITAVTKSGKGTGSGFFISDRVIVTNYHVIDGATLLSVVDYNGNSYVVDTLYDYDSTVDIALLGIRTQNPHKAVPMDIGYVPAVGEKVYTIGSPVWYTGSMSEGIVSMSECRMDGVSYIQTDAPISRGNSGGPLINKYGDVIGINTLTQGMAQNLNFSLSIYYFSKMSSDHPTDISKFYASNM